MLAYTLCEFRAKLSQGVSIFVKIWEFGVHLGPEMGKTLQRCCRNHAKMQFWMTPYPTFECFRLKVLAEACLIAPAPANKPAGASALLVRAAQPK